MSTTVNPALHIHNYAGEPIPVTVSRISDAGLMSARIGLDAFTIYADLDVLAQIAADIVVACHREQAKDTDDAPLPVTS